MKLWDYVESISSTKRELEFDPRVYNAFMVNRALSQHVDAVLYANEVNAIPGMDPEMQYRYLREYVRKRRRYGGKWPKRVEDEGIKVVMEYYGCTRREAVESLMVMRPGDLERIMEEMKVGDE